MALLNSARHCQSVDKSFRHSSTWNQKRELHPTAETCMLCICPSISCANYVGAPPAHCISVCKSQFSRNPRAARHGPVHLDWSAALAQRIARKPCHGLLAQGGRQSAASAFQSRAVSAHQADWQVLIHEQQLKFCTWAWAVQAMKHWGSKSPQTQTQLKGLQFTPQHSITATSPPCNLSALMKAKCQELAIPQGNK